MSLSDSPMLQFNAHTLGALIMSQSDEALCGVCEYCIVDFTDGKVVALYVRTGHTAHGNRSVLLLQDILSFSDEIFISSPEVLADPSDIVRLQPILEKKHIITSLPVRTASGTMLGIVIDFVFDDMSGYIEKFHVGKKRLLSKPRTEYIIHRDMVNKITPDAILLKTDEASPIRTEEELEKMQALRPEPSFMRKE